MNSQKWGLPIALTFGLLLVSGTVWAATNQSEIDAINAKIKTYQKLQDLKAEQSTQLSTQIQGLDSQVGDLEAKIKENETQIQGLDVQIQTLSTKLAQQKPLIDKQEERLQGLILQESEENVPAESSWLFSSLLIDTAVFDVWQKDVTGTIVDELEKLQILKATYAKEQKELQIKRDDIANAELQLSQRQQYLGSVKYSKEKLLVQSEAEKNKYGNLVDQLEKEREELENEIEKIESGKIDDLVLKSLPKYKKGLLAYPLDKYVLTQSYGNTSYAKRSGAYGRANFHNGLDFGAPTGTSVKAAASGKVVAIGNNGRYAYGKYVAIDHGNGIITMYGHLSAYKAKLGEKVDQGDTIGLIGSTGASTGPHLHFTVFATKSFEIKASSSISSVKDIPVGATVNPKVYLP